VICTFIELINIFVVMIRSPHQPRLGVFGRVRRRVTCTGRSHCPHVLTVFRATAAANVRSSTRMGPGGRLVHGTIGAALAARQETRRAGYGDLLGQHRLLVFAVDEYGMMSRDA
jgi:hypothetical protein